jgi:aminoglycoside phosphotransferase (APT) family kinase protein
MTASGSPLYGDALSAADELLLRGAPPARAIAWCERAAGARVTGVRALTGGTSSAVHAVDLDDGRALVLRRFVRADWLAEEPDIAEREAAALTLVERCALPTPRLVAVDPTGADAGDPAVLMTRLEGAITWRPADLDGFLQGLAGLLPPIHATPAAGAPLPDYEPYALETREPPRWSRRPDVWERAFAIFDGPAPAGPRVLVHRDFHPGNVLWAGGAVSGVIDWASAEIGAPGADIGHCRWNLARALSLDAADRFLALTGVGEYDPYWDVVAALGGYDDVALEAKTPREEEFLARAVARR